MSKKNELDQYYTNPWVAKLCVDQLKSWVSLDGKVIVEPSAGAGAFLDALDGKVEAYDLDPKAEGIVKRDFFDVTDLCGKIVVGNPPFGFASSLALKFINHAAKHGAEVVAFILPRTFKKKMFQRKVDNNVHLLYCMDLPRDSFILDGVDYDVPCTFQIWKRKTYKRVDTPVVKHFTQGSMVDHDFILRRVGGRAGQVIRPEEYTESTSLYVKGSLSLFLKHQAQVLINATWTAGVRSISLDEINLIVEENNK